MIYGVPWGRKLIFPKNRLRHFVLALLRVPICVRRDGRPLIVRQLFHRQERLLVHHVVPGMAGNLLWPTKKKLERLFRVAV